MRQKPFCGDVVKYSSLINCLSIANIKNSFNLGLLPLQINAANICIDRDIMEIILQTLLLAFLLGGMIFFPTVVAPTIFKSLDTLHAGLFLRKLFPSYYVFIIVVSGFAAILDDFKNPVFLFV